MIRHGIRDEAIASAKSQAHAVVEPRHVLWAIVRILGDATPPGVARARVRAALDPRGSAIEPPEVGAEAEAIIDEIDSRDRAAEVAIRMVGNLGLEDKHEHNGDSATGSAAAVEVERETESMTEEVASPADAIDQGSINEILAELDALVGLETVKRDVRRLLATRRANAERRAQGLPEVSTSNHLVFTGSAGTGKTTVARLIARLYGAAGIVSKGHLVEATRSELVAGYVGQTALKTEQVVRRAIGGVLFIDEAYALSLDAGHGFGSEAIATLVKLMEDNRGDLVVIVAGYEGDMRQFISANPGLRSRFSRYVDFPDYSSRELTSVFESIAREAEVGLGEGVLGRVEVLLEAGMANESFGNARFVRTLFEEAYANMATRALEDGVIEEGELDQLVVADLPAADHGRSVDFRRIGFGSVAAG